MRGHRDRGKVRESREGVVEIEGTEKGPEWGPDTVPKYIPKSHNDDIWHLLSRRWYILHYHRSTLLLSLGERLLLVVVEWKREAK